MKVRALRHRPLNQQDQGYALLLLLLTLCLLTIAAMAIAPTIAFEVKRDREEEFIHRAVQYSRAVRRYAKSTGRYPLDLQDLNGKNGMRYIRKLYKDPITGQDFKLLYMNDVMNATANVPQNGQPVQHDISSATDPNQGQTSTDTPDALQNNSTNTSIFASRNQSSSPQIAGVAGPASTVANGSTAFNGPSPGVFFGVVSKSKEKTIREFEHKNHYNQWLFFYDQNHETGFLVTGPTRLTLPATSQVGQSAAGPASSPIGQPGIPLEQPAVPQTN